MKVKIPIAVVLGDIDMLRPLVLAGIPAAVCAGPRALPRYSRYARTKIPWRDPWIEPDALVDELMRFGAEQKEKPILFYESDADLLMISRHRDRLAESYRFVIPDPEIVEILVDKLRFQDLARSLKLPVPASKFFPANETNATANGLAFPVIAKPLTRRVAEWAPVAGLSKAVSLSNESELFEFHERMRDLGIDFLVQELIPGDESRIESYHVYIDGNGSIAGEFAGKKIRTYPQKFGQSCALTLTDAEDVIELGRQIVERVGLRGVAKLDFKRRPDRELALLEINPRFNLWHHLGAVAGVNLPLIVYCDLTGRPRPSKSVARAGTNWCRLWQDVFAARAEGVPFRRWLPWAIKCEAKAGLAFDDPLPVFRAFFYRATHRRKPPPARSIAAPA